MRMWLLLLTLLASLEIGCAIGSASPVDAHREDPRPIDARRDLPPDTGVDRAPVDLGALDRAADRGADQLPDQPGPDLGPDAKADLGCGCGVGLICAGGTCVCDPATCAGCCTSDGKACKVGKDDAECGTGGVVCKACSTSDPCKTASCATGACVLAAKAGAPYPCPGAFGTVCGGSTGVACQSGLTCVTFTAGAKGFCSKTCTSSGATCSGAPPGTTSTCILAAGTKQYCGFECSPGLCPTGLSCDYFEEYCKP